MSTELPWVAVVSRFFFTPFIEIKIEEIGWFDATFFTIKWGFFFFFFFFFTLLIYKFAICDNNRRGKAKMPDRFIG